ncbi:Fe-Mn family superoxide dismutase [Halomonas sabkhae]|uniref:Fe-Mn family superoxide dismutase n=1 Tax=Halomonas sabkhae TaxID=626223 RepID=UPI0025B553F8|nr:Fe-Mn family superoxide dismutase [Halomonas sabkhae]MDN3526445.1 Fe-Mn family superoxide dismutase [Halomonas sabkhae]
MAFLPPALPYEKHALEPQLSVDWISERYDGRHRQCLARLNSLVADSPLADASLEDLLHSAFGETFSLAAEAWSLTFYWHCLAPRGGGKPAGAMARAIEAAFGSFDQFERNMTAAARDNRTSAWSWLVQDANGNLVVIDSPCPLASGHFPLLAIEASGPGAHSPQTPDHRAYLKAVWKVINWDFVARQHADVGG